LHILTITPFYPSQDDEANGCFIAEPLQALASMGVTNSVLVASPIYRRRPPAHGDAPSAASLHYFSLPSGWGLSTAGLFLFTALLGRMRDLHGKRPIHLIHAHAALPCGHAAMLLSKELDVPFMVSVHGLDAYSDKQVPGRPGTWCRRISQLVFRSAARVVCISERVREQVLEGTPDAKSTVVYNGADPVRFSPGEQTPEGPPRIVTVGNLISIKGHATLLQAVTAIRDNHPSLICEFAGAGPELPRLMELAENMQLSDRVRFLGRKNRDDVANLLCNATLFALPSIYEGLGCAYLEAMACGKAAIACRGQGIAEVIRHGSNGWLVGPDNPSELADGLNSLLGNRLLREHIGQTARQTILQSYTIEHQAMRLRQTYEECTG